MKNRKEKQQGNMREFKCIFVDWERAYDICKEVCEAVRRSEFRPEVVVGISRGGLFLARILCDFFLLKDLLCLKMEHWGITATITGKAEMKYGIDERAKEILRSKKVIIADDITDTGESLRLASSFLRSIGAVEVKTATMHHKTVSSFVPDFYGERMEEWKWVIYPWSFYEDFSELVLKILVDAAKISVFDLREELFKRFGIWLSLHKLQEVLENMAFHGKIMIEKEKNGKEIVVEAVEKKREK